MPEGFELSVGPGGLPRNFEAISRNWMAEHAKNMATLTNRPATPVSTVAIVNPRQQADLLQAMMLEVSNKVPMSPSSERFLKVTSFVVSQLLAKRILGQYVPEWQAPGRSGLYLVKPNIEAQAKAIGVAPLDLAKYVSLHEATHHWQFTANPWLEKYMQDSLGDMVSGGALKPMAVMSKVEQLQAAMSLVEGHANFMAAKLADAATQAVHDRFNQVKAEAKPQGNVLMKIISKITQMDQKSRQYVDGEKFCEAVYAAGGHALLDKAWTGPSTLPSSAEIANPALWISRMTSSGTGSQAA